MSQLQGHSAPQKGNDPPARFKFRVVTIVPSERQHALDHALEETFPASDPISITITEAVRVPSDGSPSIRRASPVGGRC